MSKMTKWIILMSLAVSLVLPLTSRAWVAAGRSGYGGACWHGGYSCAGVSTGTVRAYGNTAFVAGTVVGASSYPVVYSSSAYTAPPPVVVVQGPSIGSIVHSLPAGCQYTTVNFLKYYVCGGTYYQAFFGNNGVYYEVVAGP